MIIDDRELRNIVHNLDRSLAQARDALVDLTAETGRLRLMIQVYDMEKKKEEEL